MQKLNKEKYEKIKEKKRDTPIETLCAKLPKEFVKYLNYCRSLNFEDKPCLSDLRKLFKKLLTKRGLEVDNKFDWIKKKGGIPKEITFEEEDEEDTDYKKRLKNLLGG
uniref:Uncharacterized protein n=1 Tax=Euplotes crassus TaxID=5936 RepID=A0A7S3K6U0_EUPCR|mmetsp:Transcript_12534/g.12580  ORF Transcript_12534/g.12580 Transcript_12534/m.12580 type:complete len:108 (+) Transcript_12534:653-976(+)